MPTPYSRGTQGGLFAPPGSQSPYLPLVTRQPYVYPEQRAMTAQQWSPASWPWQAPGFQWPQVQQQAPMGAPAYPAAPTITPSYPGAPGGAGQPGTWSPVTNALGAGSNILNYMQSVADRIYGQQQPQAQQPQYRPPTQQQAGGQAPYAQAPQGVDPGWYRRFQGEHEGQTPEQFYGAQGTGEGLAEALGDLEWSQGFAGMYGRPPTDDDWKAWWFQSRVGASPQDIAYWQSPAGKRDLQRKRERASGGEGVGPRPPNWIPPPITWRT